MSRFKTELCNNLIELGSCKYGDRCHYAHGAHELRQVSKRHPKYRTEKCKNFELTGKCPFGPRCSYVHPKPDLDSMIEQLTKYLKHTRAPKPDPEDDDDMIINTRTTANDITNTANPISTSALSPNNILQPISITNSSLLQATGDENKENQLVINYQVSNDPLSDHYNDHALALNNSPFIQGTNTSSLTKAFSINSINTTNSTTNSAFTTSSSSNNVSSQAATSSSSILRTPLRNPLSDYLNNTNTILGRSPLQPNRQFYTRF